MKQWIEDVMLGEENNIIADDLKLIPITDSPDEVLKIIRDYYAEGKGHHLEPNYEL